MSNEIDGNRFAPPTAAVADVGVATAGALAGRFTRLGAVIIDGLVIACLFWLLSLFTPINIFDPSAALAGGTSGLLMMTIRNLLIGFVIYLAVNGYLLHTQGQTIGKKLLGIRILRSDGSRATLLRLAGLRYLANSMVGGIPFVGGLYLLVDSLMIFRDSRKCLHDDIADTIVVKA
ncbi:MAG: RDD family protein [Pseudomonadota bacterium]|nr:RDD family protein [Pseudomonadota bacterium]